MTYELPPVIYTIKGISDYVDKVSDGMISERERQIVFDDTRGEIGPLKFEAKTFYFTLSGLTQSLDYKTKKYYVGQKNYWTEHDR